jgi:predicted xylose isomerase-like sugar epimerase
MYDRIRLDFTSDVTEAQRGCIEDAIALTVKDLSLYAYMHFDKECGAWSIDITAHDRTRSVELTDGQLVARLKSISADKGITIADMLREAGKL